MDPIQNETAPRRGAYGRGGMRAMAVCLAALSGLLVVPSLTPPVFAQEAAAARETLRQYDIPAGPLARVLNAFAERSGVFISGAGTLTEGRTSPGLRGEYTVEEALDRLLADTGLTFRFTDADTVTLARANPEGADGPLELGPITVEAQARSPVELPQTEGYKADFTATGTLGTPLPLEEVPQPVSVVTSDSLEDRRVLTTEKALETVPNVASGNTGNSQSAFRSQVGDQFQLRGFTALVRDNGFGANGRDLASTHRLVPDPVVVDRYEVVKGATGVLNFTTQAGGLINRISKTPQPETFAEVTATAGSYDLYRAELDANHAFADGLIEGRLLAAYTDEDSFVDFTFRERATIAPVVDVNFAQDSFIRFGLRYEEQDSNADRGVPFFADGQVPGVSRSTFGGVPGGFQENEHLSAYSQFVYTVPESVRPGFLGNLTIDGGFRYEDYSNEQLVFRAGSFVDPDDNTFTVSSLLQDVETESYQGNINITGTFQLLGQEQGVLIGYARSKTEQPLFFGGDFTGVTQNIFNIDPSLRPAPVDESDFFPVFFQEEDVDSVYGQAVLRPLDGLTLIGNVRYDEVFAGFTFDGSDSRETESEVTYRVGAVYDWTQRVRTFVNYATVFEPQNGITRDGSRIGPADGSSLEGGIEVDLFGDRALARVSVFHLVRRNVARADPENMPGDPFVVPVGEQVHNGVELELNGEILPGWNVSAQFGYLDAEFEDFEPFTGNQVPVSPQVSGTLWTTYELQSGDWRGLGAGFGIRALGDREVNEANDFEVDGFTRADASVFYRGFDNVELQLNVNNLFDERFVEQPINDQNFFFGAPRTFIGTARVRF